jgi:hypothetical protein
MRVSCCCPGYLHTWMSLETIRPRHGSVSRSMNCRAGWIESGGLRPAAASSMPSTMDRVEFPTSISLMPTGLRTLSEPRNISTPSGLCGGSHDGAYRRGPSSFCDSPPHHLQDVEHAARAASELAAGKPLQWRWLEVRKCWRAEVTHNSAAEIWKGTVLESVGVGVALMT